VVRVYGQPERSAHLLGAARTLSIALGIQDLGPQLQDPYDPVGYERLVGGVRAALGEDAFAAALAVGEHLPLAEAIALALEASAAG
jgi:hypothetical protein